MAEPTLSICVPVYNEEENLPLLHEAICKVIDPLKIDAELLLVDDGSKDRSWEVIRSLVEKDARVRGLKFAFNCGETAASDAGLRAARGKYVMTMDADLQNDPALNFHATVALAIPARLPAATNSFRNRNRFAARWNGRRR